MNVIQDKEFMQHFWDLAVDDAEVRMAAAAKVTANDIPSNYKSYTLKRLVKGLTSPRDSARLGFATALTQFLVNHQVDPQEVLTLIDEHTKVRRNAPDEVPVHFLMLFMFRRCLVRSKALKSVTTCLESCSVLPR